jgi:hypothetical protein
LSLASEALRSQAYLHNRINFRWNVRRELLPTFMAHWFRSKPTAEQDAIKLLQASVDDGLHERLDSIKKSLCKPEDPVARNTLIRLLSLIDRSLNKHEDSSIACSRYHASVNLTRPC